MLYNINRRRFLKDSAAALSISMLGPYALDITQRRKPWRVGLIGTGWYGKSDLFRLNQVANIEVVGLCDVDQHQLKEAATWVKERKVLSKEPPTFTNYQELLNKTSPEIVLIGTPDHWHALQAIDAMKSGAHVYLQKPISIDVLEGEAIRTCAQQTNRVVQIGTQRRSTAHLVNAKEQIVDAGLLGKISHVEMCCYYHMRANKRPPVQAIPSYFDYNQWVGPAPYRPYDGLPHRGWWRAMMEYSNGIMGDMCVHMLDTVRWMLGLGWPNQISSQGGIYVQTESKANTPDTQSAVFSYDDLNCIWQHRSWGSAPDPEYPWAFFIYGEKGTLKGSVQKFEFIPLGDRQPIKEHVLLEKEKFPEDVTEKDIEIHVAPATRAHMVDFLSAIETGSMPVANIDEGHISTASCVLANVAMKLKRPLTYNPEKRIIEYDQEATNLLKRDYREGFIHPATKI